MLSPKRIVNMNPLWFFINSKRVFVTLLLGPFISQVLWAQNENNFFSQMDYAMFYYANHEHSKADSILSKELPNRPDYAHYYDLIALITSPNKDSKRTLDKLLSAVSHGADSTGILTYLESKNIEMSNETLTLFNSRYKQFRNKYKSQLDFELCLELQKLLTKDQLFRKGYKSNELYGVSESERWRLQRKFDSLNLRALLNICKEKGWPTHKNAGTLFYVPSLILWHNRHDECFSISLEELKPFVQKKIAQNELPTFYLVKFDDFLAYEEKGQQIYGTLTGLDSNNISYVKEIENINLVDSRRKKKGMIPLHMKCKISGVQLPINYKHP